MATTRYKKGSNAQLSTHFNLREFDCKCTHCQETLIDPELINKLEVLRTNLGEKPIRINSGYRCHAYQNELRLRGYETASRTSEHELGRAADVAETSHGIPGGTLEKAARLAGFKAVGVGGYWIHVDLREDKERRWTYASS